MQVFDFNPWKAWSAVAITLTSVAFSLYLIAMSPWYLLPFAWAFAGTAWTGVSASLLLGLVLLPELRLLMRRPEVSQALCEG